MDRQISGWKGYEGWWEGVKMVRSEKSYFGYEVEILQRKGKPSTHFNNPLSNIPVVDITAFHSSIKLLIGVSQPFISALPSLHLFPAGYFPGLSLLPV